MITFQNASLTIPETKSNYIKTDGISSKKFVFSEWNTEKDGSGTVWKPNDKITLTTNLTLYAQYIENPQSDNDEDDENALDICKTAGFEMKIGEAVLLKASCDIDANCYYSITENDYDAIEISEKTLTAKSIGMAKIRVYSIAEPSRFYYCEITVTSDDFTGNTAAIKVILFLMQIRPTQ